MKRDEALSKQIDVLNNAELTQRLSFAQQANDAARLTAFADYRSRRAHITLRHQDAELANFGESIGPPSANSRAASSASDLNSGLAKRLVSNLRYSMTLAETWFSTALS